MDASEIFPEIYTAAPPRVPPVVLQEVPLPVPQRFPAMTPPGIFSEVLLRVLLGSYQRNSCRNSWRIL